MVQRDGGRARGRSWKLARHIQRRGGVGGHPITRPEVLQIDLDLIFETPPRLVGDSRQRERLGGLRALRAPNSFERLAADQDAGRRCLSRRLCTHMLPWGQATGCQGIPDVSRAPQQTAWQTQCRVTCVFDQEPESSNSAKESS